MKIAYLLESTALCGGVKVVFRQVEALNRRGHDAVVICKEGFPAWFEGRVPFQQQHPFEGNLLSRFERILATSPLMVSGLYAKREFRSKLWHLVQGYEGDYGMEVRHIKHEIDAGYCLPVPKMTVSKRLADRLKKMFPGRHFASVGQGLEHQCFFPAESKDSSGSPADRIFLIGPLSISIKNIHLGLAAFKKVRRWYPGLQLIRISTVDTRLAEEAVVGPIDNYHLHLTPAAVGSVLRSGNGILLSPSGPGEGFGLPALEAMGSGVPAVLTDIPSYRAFSHPCDYAVFVPPGDPDAMARGLLNLMARPDERQRLRARGLEVAAAFTYDRVAQRIEKNLMADGNVKAC